MPHMLPYMRWSLKPPFHPYRHRSAVYFCCTSLGVTSTGRYPASCPVKPGLSSCSFWLPAIVCSTHCYYIAKKSNYKFILSIFSYSSACSILHSKHAPAKMLDAAVLTSLLRSLEVPASHIVSHTICYMQLNSIYNSNIKTASTYKFP